MIYSLGRKLIDLAAWKETALYFHQGGREKEPRPKTRNRSKMHQLDINYTPCIFLITLAIKSRQGAAGRCSLGLLRQPGWCRAWI